jgi:L-threonylcarbamoyladenylate synthase
MINLSELDLAIELLKHGKLIVFPTETVYALAGDARNLSAVKQIFMLKGRPLNQPLSVLLAEDHSLDAWARDISPLARKLAQHFWPGPLTLILHKEKSVLSELTGGQNKIGLRVPDHPIAQAILKGFASGLAAPSANRSAHFSPTQIEHVRQEFDNKLELIIDGGPCSLGIESTIIDVTVNIPRILRLGAISLESIRQIIPCKWIKPSIQSHQFSSKLILQQIARGQLEEIIETYLNQGKTLTVFGLSAESIRHKNLVWIVMPNNSIQYAQVLYKYLHEAEQRASDKILVESVPELKVWSGIQSILDKNSV